MRKAALALVLLSLGVVCPAQNLQPLHGTLVVATPVRGGLVACSDKRLFNDVTKTADDSFVKIRKVNSNTLFVATNTIGFLDSTTGKRGFDVFDITSKYAGGHDFAAGRPFWDGLKEEIKKRLLDHLSKQKFEDWPETDTANNKLLFNLIFYSVAERHVKSHSLSVFYEKARTPVIYIPDVVSQTVRGPQLSGKGKDVMAYLAADPGAARDPAILRFDQGNFDVNKITVLDAVTFANKLFTLATSAVPRAQVSAAHDCALLSYQNGFEWIDDSGGPISK
jgi:hypothetical protein